MIWISLELSIRIVHLLKNGIFLFNFALSLQSKLIALNGDSLSTYLQSGEVTAGLKKDTQVPRALGSKVE